LINVSPSALKAYLACQRSWFLQYVAKAPKVVPHYVTAGTQLDMAVQRYLQGSAPVGADGPDLDKLTADELAVTKAELPHPGTVMVQYRPPSVPVPGLEGQARITTGGLDYMTPPNAQLIVIGDLKRIWHKDAAMTPEALANDVQAQMYAWLVWQAHAPVEIIFRWTYCVRAVVSAKGEVTRKPKAFSVDVKADRARVDAWFGDVVLPAARGMLDIQGPVDAVEHDPDSCESGNRCFVATSCPMFKGPIKGAIHVDLSRFKTNAAKAAEAIVAQNDPLPAKLEGFDIAINPPALPGNAPRLTGNRLCDIGLNNVKSRETDAPDTVLDVVDMSKVDTIDVGRVEGSAEALAMLGVAEYTPPKPKRTRKVKPEAQATAEADDAPATERAPVLALDAASTEQIMAELQDRGWRVYLEAGRG
jgi:hypothetical protein